MLQGDEGSWFLTETSALGRHIFQQRRRFTLTLPMAKLSAGERKAYYLTALEQHRQLLRAAIEQMADGKLVHALTIATSIRALVHETGSSTPLLKRLRTDYLSLPIFTAAAPKPRPTPPGAGCPVHGRCLSHGRDLWSGENDGEPGHPHPAHDDGTVMNGAPLVFWVMIGPPAIPCVLGHDRATRPSSWRGAGTDPVSPRPCVSPNYRTLSWVQAAASERRKRSDRPRTRICLKSITLL